MRRLSARLKGLRVERSIRGRMNYLSLRGSALFSLTGWWVELLGLSRELFECAARWIEGDSEPLACFDIFRVEAVASQMPVC